MKTWLTDKFNQPSQSKIGFDPDVFKASASSGCSFVKVSF